MGRQSFGGRGGGVGVGVADGWGEDGSVDVDDGIGDGGAVWGGKMTLVSFDVGGWLRGNNKIKGRKTAKHKGNETARMRSCVEDGSELKDEENADDDDTKIRAYGEQLELKSGLKCSN